MSDPLAALRERHIPVGRAPGWPPFCDAMCEGDWPCDFAIALAALDAVTAERDAAQKDAARLAEAGERLRRRCFATDEYTGDAWDAALAAHRARVAPEPTP